MKLFEDLPSTNTPINAENLNRIQDNLVVVSKTEPTGDNREKIWVQKGQNLFNKNTAPRVNMYVKTSDNTFEDNYTSTYSTYIEIKPNTTYTISKVVGKTFRIATSSAKPANKGSVITTTANHTASTITVTTNSNDKYLFINYYNTENGDTAGENVIRDSIQIEQGSTATEYETYIEPKIYVKNDNDVYEEFAGTQTITNDKGTAVKYPDGTMICRGTNSRTLNLTQKSNGAYFCSFETVNFPQEFIEAPTVTATCSINTSLIATNVFLESKTGFGSYVWTIEAISNVTIKQNYIAIGKWK